MNLLYTLNAKNRAFLEEIAAKIQDHRNYEVVVQEEVIEGQQLIEVKLPGAITVVAYTDTRALKGVESKVRERV